MRITAWDGSGNENGRTGVWGLTLCEMGGLDGWGVCSSSSSSSSLIIKGLCMYIY